MGDLVERLTERLRRRDEEIERLRSLCLEAAAALVGPADSFEGCQEVIDKIHSNLKGRLTDE